MNLDRIQHWIDQGRLKCSPDAPITAKELLLSGCIHSVHDGVKILGDVSYVNIHEFFFSSSSGCRVFEDALVCCGVESKSECYQGY